MFGYIYLENITKSPTKYSSFIKGLYTTLLYIIYYQYIN